MSNQEVVYETLPADDDDKQPLQLMTADTRLRWQLAFAMAISLLALIVAALTYYAVLRLDKHILSSMIGNVTQGDDMSSTFNAMATFRKRQAL